MSAEPEPEEGIRNQPWYRLFLKLAQRCAELEGRIYVLETGGIPCPACNGIQLNLCGICNGKGVLNSGEKDG